MSKAMFLKPYKLKSNSPLRGSDNKKVRQRLEQTYPDLTAEHVQCLWPNKGNASILKVITHSEFVTNVFCIDKVPMFFETEDGILAPTLYAMWQVPNLLPYFTTLPGVLPKLSNGADLMLPGVIPQGTGMNIYGRYKKGQIVAINLTTNKSAVGVGFLPRSSDDLYMSGGRGSAVKLLHLFGDKLWAHEPSAALQVPNNKPAELKDEDFPELGATAKKPQDKLPTDINILPNTSTNETTADEPDLPSVADLVLANDLINPTLENDIESEELSADIILKNAFLAALKNHGKTMPLPLLTSNFYRLYVVPEATEQLNLKKTKYKKLSNFLNDMIDQGFITVREETKGIDKITSIDLEHPELVNFITDYKKADPSDVEGKDKPLFHSELTELYIVTDETAAFFTTMDIKRGEGISSTQVKKILRQYISKNNLPISDNTTKSIKLDECLSKLCDCTDASLSKICNVVLSKMNHSYQMCSVKDAAPNKPLIQMSIATRSGNKKVTLVSNIECYGIIVPEFIKLCKQGAAASTTIVKLPNQKREQLQIQGNQIRFVYNLLTETYKVPGKCILGLELAKDGRKHKK